MTKAKSVQNQFVGKTIGGYKICTPIGKGYSGYVYRGTKEGKEYAVKIIKSELIKDKVEEKKQLGRIKTQKEISRKIFHPNIIRIIGGGKCKATGFLYLIMEYLNSEVYTPLNNWAEELSVENIRVLLSQIASAAETLHDHGYSHRDIKPSNIMISNKGDKAILLDLGVVKNNNYIEFNIPETEESYKEGSDNDYMTLRYTPKELLYYNDFKEIKNYKSEAMSLYQLGAILYVLMSGKQLFPGIINHNKEWLKLPSAIGKGISRNDLNKELHDKIYPDYLKNMALRLLDKNWKTRLQVEWKDFNFEKYEPTLVFLFSGGTIGSEGEKERGLIDTIGENKLFFTKISDRVMSDYKQIYEPENNFPFKIDWESLSKEDLILSENATPGYWNAIMRKLQEIIKKYGNENIENKKVKIKEKNNNYLAGIIILHGTDTLAYTASALTFGMKYLPCPVIITGSNQPPNEESLNEKNILKSKSDVWKNLGLSVNFIQSFGHRYTELFIAFNSTIFHSYNLKKVPLHNAFELGNSVESAINEPYTYQNIYLPRKFMFKWIDGFFCNNFYPVYGTTYFELTTNGRLHTRDEVSVNSNKFEIIEFIENKLELIVCSPISDYKNINLKNKDAIILVGYDSGTFPSVKNHGLSKYLIEWTEQGKLIFLVSEFGLFPSEIKYKFDKFALSPSDNNDKRIKPYPLFGLIKETAIPFVLHLLTVMEKQETNGKVLKEAPLDKKHDAIKKLLNNKHWENSLPGIIIRKPFEHSELEKLLTDYMMGVRQDYFNSENKLFYGLEEKLMLEFAKSEVGNTHQSKQSRNDVKSLLTVKLPPELSLWFILRKCKKSFALGYGPTAFKELNDMGFRFGRNFFNHVSKLIKTDGSDTTNNEIWTSKNVDKERKRITLKKIEDIVGEFHSRLKKMGIVDTKHCLISSDALRDDSYSLKQSSITLSVNTKQNNALDKDDVFAVTQFDREERDFFKYIKEGTPFGVSNDFYMKNINNRLIKLIEHTWDKTNIQPIEWLTLGIFKGLMVESLLALKFDEWVNKFNSRQHKNQIKQFLKNSISTNIIQSDNNKFNFEMRYISR